MVYMEECTKEWIESAARIHFQIKKKERLKER